MRILVDTSIWIDYFRGGDRSDRLDHLIDENLIVTNDVILTELIPSLKLRNQHRLVSLLGEIEKLPLEIDWESVIGFQYHCLKSGANGVGIPDLIIAHNAMANDCPVYSLDRHFRLMSEVIGVALYDG